MLNVLNGTKLPDEIIEALYRVTTNFTCINTNKHAIGLMVLDTEDQRDVYCNGYANIEQGTIRMFLAPHHPTNYNNVLAWGKAIMKTLLHECFHIWEIYIYVDKDKGTRAKMKYD